MKTTWNRLTLLALLLAAALPLQLAGCATTGAGKAAARRDAIYWCNCGPDCKCNSVATRPGTCACGKEMAGGHVIFTEGNTALVCTCGPDCSCRIDPNDHTKCGCGNPVKRVNLEGTGLYFCNCGGSCGCNVVSDTPGPCTCGMPLKQAK